MKRRGGKGRRKKIKKVEREIEAKRAKKWVERKGEEN